MQQLQHPSFTVRSCGEKPWSCQGWCCHFADRFCLTAWRLRASPQRESLIKFPFIPASPSSSPRITLHYNTSAYMPTSSSLHSKPRLFFSPSLDSLSCSALHLSSTPPPHHFPASPLTQSNPSACSVLSLKKKTKNGKWNCGRIPPVQVSVMCCDERTQRHRGLLIMEHTGPLAAAAPTGDAEGGGRGGERRSEWVTVEPTEHRTRAKEFRRHAGGDAWGWKLGISQKIRGGGRDGAQKHRGVQRRREGGEVPLPLRFALLLTRAGGRASDCTCKGRREEQN